MSNVDNDELFTQEQYATILSHLEAVCNGPVCVSRPDIFQAIQSSLGDMTELSFNNKLSDALRLDKLPLFATRRGRTGGIHRKGVFDQHDATRKLPKIQTTIEVDGKQLVAKAKAKVLEKYVVDVLGGKLDTNGNVKIGDLAYLCDIDAFNKYLNAMVGVV